jgi:hypothetical protein
VPSEISSDRLPPIFHLVEAVLHHLHLVDNAAPPSRPKGLHTAEAAILQRRCVCRPSSETAVTGLLRWRPRLKIHGGCAVVLYASFAFFVSAFFVSTFFVTCLVASHRLGCLRSLCRSCALHRLHCSCHCRYCSLSLHSS